MFTEVMFTFATVYKFFLNNLKYAHLFIYRSKYQKYKTVDHLIIHKLKCYAYL